MNRKLFIKNSIISLLGVLIIPKIIKDQENKNNIVFDGCSGYLDLSKFEVYYDFTKSQYGIYDINGNLIGWKDISGHNNHAAGNPYQYPFVKKFAVSKGTEIIKNYVEYF